MDSESAHARSGIIVGRSVQRVKQERARSLRRSMTPEETLLWQHLRAHRLDGLHWRRQQVIDGFIADFYCHAAGVVIELDGAIHQRQVEYDRARDDVFAQSNLLVLRFANSDIRDQLDTVLARIRAACQRRLA